MWYNTQNRQFPANENERPGIVATFSCYSAYMLAGSSSATCNSDGSWTFTNGAPVCISKAITNSSFAFFIIFNFPSFEKFYQVDFYVQGVDMLLNTFMNAAFKSVNIS